MIQISLPADWTLHALETPDQKILATVPGCVHTDLLTAGRIPDPWFRDQEKDTLWVWEKDWVYECGLHCPEAVTRMPFQRLRFEGLDTLCRVELNGVLLGAADNMHRTWEWDAAPHLKPGQNRLRITFPSPRGLLLSKDAEHSLPQWNLYHSDFLGKSYLRKMACAFGWDWGLMAPTAGIWRAASLIAYTRRLDDIHIRQDHRDGQVRLHITARTGGPGPVTLTLRKDGHTLAERVVEAADTLKETLEVPSPALWWPNGMGGQDLYEVILETAEGQREVKRIGLRTLELVREPDEFGESFRFRINGRDTFMKGGNWIPCDIFPSRVSTDTYRNLLRSCADSHMNMIRVWGGGIYEDDRFYNLCDEYGLLVWQDFMFACSTYPTFDPTFLDNVKQEAIDNIRRLRHHPCIALWCGNNELEQGLVRFDITDWTPRSMPPQEYAKLFDQLLPEVTAAVDPDTPYWPCSPHSPHGDRNHFNNPECGDAHAWSVWFGGQSFESQRDWNFRFMSEFGFQSYPELKTIESFTHPEDRSLSTWIMDFHQRSGPGNKTIYTYLLDWFREPASFEATLLLTQLTQALCIQYAAEHARRIQGRMDGLLYWQINDLWPGATWSSIDVYGRWKALQHLARRFFEPVSLSLLEHPDRGVMAYHLSNHRPEGFQGELHWLVTTCAGEVLRSGTLPVAMDSQRGGKIFELDAMELRKQGGSHKLPLEIRAHTSIPMEGDRDLLFWGILTENGRECSRNLGFFAKPKYWKLQTPDYQIDLRKDQGRVTATIHSDVCAPWTLLSLDDAELSSSDNWFHVLPGHPRTVILENVHPDELPGLRARLRCRSLQELCR